MQDKLKLDLDFEAFNKQQRSGLSSTTTLIVFLFCFWDWHLCSTLWNGIRVSKWFPLNKQTNKQCLIAAPKPFFSKMIFHLLPLGKLHQHHLLQHHLNQLQHPRKYVNPKLATWVNDLYFNMDNFFNIKMLIVVLGDFKGKCILTSYARVKSTSTTQKSSSPT